jgi:hypothetical protein
MSKPKRVVCTKLRSQVHMLAVAAARLEQTSSNPRLVADLRKASDDFAKRLSQGEGLDAADDERIAKQRESFASIPAIPAMSLRMAMLQRAYDLMWKGDCTACDALVEFLPVEDVEEMFATWEADQEGEAKSKYYRREFAP